jgi:FkbM family methyltransferase
LAVKNLRQFALSIWTDESNRRQRMRHLALAGAWQVWKRLFRKPLTRSLFNGMRLRVYPDCMTSSGVFYYRIPNGRSIEFMRLHMEGGTLVDVGANVGIVSILLADKLDHAWLFEPNAAAAERASENIALNNLDFVVHSLALSDRTAQVEFEDRGGVNATNRTVVGFQTAVPTVTVPCSTFDDFVQAKDRKAVTPFFVKIDVEGHENSVLRGMQQFLLHRRPRLVMFEYLARTNLKETFEIFEKAGYRVIALDAAGKPHWADVAVAPLQDLFACPREIGDQIVPD